ncbi:hypothetical protein TKK_0016531 [Trichogramma kaykai]
MYNNFSNGFMASAGYANYPQNPQMIYNGPNLHHVPLGRSHNNENATFMDISNNSLNYRSLPGHHIHIPPTRPMPDHNTVHSVPDTTINVFNKLGYLHVLIDETNFYTVKDNYVYQVLLKSFEGCDLLLSYVKDTATLDELKNQSKDLSVVVNDNEDNVKDADDAGDSSDADNENKEENSAVTRVNKLIFNPFSLAKILIQEEFMKMGFQYSLQIDKDRLEFLSKEINVIFPRERSIRYYSSSAQCKEPKGILPNQRRVLRQKWSKFYGERCSSYKSDSVIIEDSLQDLKMQQVVDDKFRENWTQLVAQREAFYNENTLATILKQIPALRTQQGCELVLNEYDSKNNLPSLQTNLSACSQKILFIAGKSTKDHIKQFLERYKERTDPLANNYLSLLLISQVLGECFVSKSKAKGGLYWKASIDEVSNSFIQHSTVDPSDTENHKLDVANKIQDFQRIYTKYKKTPKFCIIICGTSLALIKKAYIAIDDFTYDFEGSDSGFLAVETCYKLTIGLQKDFPEAAALVWKFVEYFLLGEKLGTIYGAVSNLVAKIDFCILPKAPKTTKSRKRKAT